MVNFFEQQAAARRRTALCVVLYALAVVAVTACVVPVLTATGLFLGTAADSKAERGRHVEQTVDQIAKDPIGEFSHGPKLALAIGATVATLGLVIGSSIIRYLSLRRGGSAVAQGLGARRVPPSTQDLRERRLLNIVEEMALASSVPVPDVFVMQNETGVNAFAAGHSPSDAAVCVTRGALERLNREQLQGVIAHEFSHILNGDMRLNLRLMGLLFGISCVGFLGRILLEFRGGSDKKNPLPLAGLALMIIGAVGVFFARLIQAMISRQREYLADASAVQFTRNPDGIAGALKVIGGASLEGRLLAAKAAECSHMMFASSGPSWLSGFMATHPPLPDRIRRLDPHWDGRFLPGIDADLAAADFPSGATASFHGAAGLVQTSHAAESATPAPTANHAGLNAAAVLQRVASSSSNLASLPQKLLEPARDPFTARALLLAMLLDKDQNVRAAQFHAITTDLGEATQRNTAVIAAALSQADRSVRLPLIDLSVRTLSALSQEQYRVFRLTLGKVIHADSRVDLFELCLEQVLIKHLDRKHTDARPTPVQYYALHRLKKDVAALLAAVAQAGRSSPHHARDAVQQALVSLALPPETADQVQDSGTDALIAALAVLRAVTPKLRLKLLSACADLVASDNRLDPEEAELLRAIADALDVPLVPSGM